LSEDGESTALKLVGSGYFNDFVKDEGPLVALNNFVKRIKKIGIAG